MGCTCASGDTSEPACGLSAYQHRKSVTVRELPLFHGYRSCTVTDILHSAVQERSGVSGQAGLTDICRTALRLTAPSAPSGSIPLSPKISKTYRLRIRNSSTFGPAVTVCYAPDPPPSATPDVACCHTRLRCRFRHPRYAASPGLRRSTILQVAGRLRSPEARRCYCVFQIMRAAAYTQSISVFIPNVRKSCTASIPPGTVLTHSSHQPAIFLLSMRN